MTYKSKAEQKRELDQVNRKFEKETDAMRNGMLNLRDKGNPVLVNKYYYDLPHYPHQWNEGWSKVMSEYFPEEVREVEALVEMRNDIKNTPIDPKPEPKNKAEKKIVESIKVIMERNKKNYIRGLELHEHFGTLNVYVNAHLVTNAYGTTFLRHFFYMDGKLTALNVILAVLQTIKDKEKENE